ncbi:MAG TPA: cysteine dioxygenase family protein [Phycisphaerales bacterium]|nr:cysteine dioxygenase family protein [Phycisphaerales bacterium]
MKQLAASQTLEGFLGYLDALTARPEPAELAAQLEALDISAADVAPWMLFGDDRYRRNLLRAGPMYHALVLCWRSGQRSPIHNHARSVCGVRVLKGVATETIFDHSPCGQVRAISSRDYFPGDVIVSQDADTHQMSNLQPAGQDLVTLHIYAPALTWMDTFSLEGGRITRVAEQLDHADGSGI